MKTTDLFKINRSGKRLNESMFKTFGRKLNLETFNIEQLEDARNKLRTQIYTARSSSGFNETIENDALAEAQFMHDAIVAELIDRNEHIVDNTVQEGGTFDEQELSDVLKAFDEQMNEIGGYGEPNYEKIMAALDNRDIESAMEEILNAYSDQDGGEIRSNDYDNYLDDIESEFKFLVYSNPTQRVRPNKGVAEGPRDRRDAYQRDYDNSVSGMDGKGYAHSQDGGGNDERHDLDPPVDPRENMMYNLTVDGEPLNPKPIRGRSNLIKFGKEQKDAGVDLSNAMISPVKEMKEGSRTSTEAIRAAGKMDRDSFIRFATKEYRINADAAGRFWNEVKSGAEFGTTEERVAEKFDPLKHVKNPTQGEKDAAKDVKRSSYPDRAAMLRSAEKDGRLKKDESAPPTAKGERMVKHIKQGYAQDGKLTDKEKGIAYATAWKDHNKNESINTGEDMRNLREGEIQQASAIVTAKTMVDRVGRWIEELSGMENDTLLQLGDSIRDEMGQEQAKGFIEAVAPAIQSALENLKTTREALASGVRTLTGEEQPANMLGGEPAADMSAEPDAMNPEMGVEEPAGDEFAAAEPATGGAEEAGREMRESIDRQNRLLKVLAG